MECYITLHMILMMVSTCGTRYKHYYVDQIHSKLNTNITYNKPPTSWLICFTLTSNLCYNVVHFLLSLLSFSQLGTNKLAADRSNITCYLELFYFLPCSSHQVRYIVARTYYIALVSYPIIFVAGRPCLQCRALF